ncbi:1-acyl-sn-glycerol-3-phosphate acyltransferase [Desulfarculales bacterium]
MNWPIPLCHLWSCWAVLWLGLTTVPIASTVALLGALGFKDTQVQFLTRLWARLLVYGAGCPVSLEGQENLAPGETYIFVGNHSSALDIPTLLAVLPSNFRWIAKKELFDVPIFGPSLKVAGYIPLDRDDHRKAMQSILVAAERIKAGASVLIFPEGTRSMSGNLLPFKSGGFMLALRSGRPVVPLAIIGSNQACKPKSLLVNPRRIKVVLGQPIPTQGLKPSDREHLSEQTQQAVQALLDHHSHQG